MVARNVENKICSSINPMQDLSSTKGLQMMPRQTHKPLKLGVPRSLELEQI